MKRFLILTLILMVFVLPSYAIKFQRGFEEVMFVKDSLTAIDTVEIGNLAVFKLLPGYTRPDYFILFGKMQDCWTVDTTIDTLTAPADTTIDTTWIDTTFSPTNTCSLRIDGYIDGEWYLNVNDTFLTADRNYGTINYTFRNNYYEELRFVLTGNSGWVRFSIAYFLDLSF